MNLVEELRDDFLVCTICFEEYRDPKQLPCLHTFCRHCLAKYIVGKVLDTGLHSFPCPFCRKNIQPAPGAGEAKRWADTFPTNFLLSQLSCKLKEKAAVASTSLGNSNTSNSGGGRDDSSGSGEKATDMSEVVVARVRCSEHPSFPLVGYCTRQRHGVCEECCVQRHADCIRSHVRERESRHLAEERRAECLESLGALQIKLEGIKDRISTQESELLTRREQLTAQTGAALGDLRSKLDLFLSQQEQELTSRLDDVVSKETGRLTLARHQAAELTKSVQHVSDRVDSVAGGGGGGGGGGLSVKDLALLDKAHEELQEREKDVDRLRKDCQPTEVRFLPGATPLDKALKGWTVGSVALEFKPQPSGGARRRVQRYVSDPSFSSVGTFLDQVSLPAQRNNNHSNSNNHNNDNPDVFDNAPPPPQQRGSKHGRALSPPGAAASSSSSSTAEGPGAGEWGASREHHHRRRSEGPPPPPSSSFSPRKPPTVPDFGSVLIEESRRSRSAPRRPRPLSESLPSSSSSSSSAPRRRSAVPMETAIDCTVDGDRVGGERSGERGGGGGGGERNVRTLDRNAPGGFSRVGGTESAAMTWSGNTERSSSTPSSSSTDPGPPQDEDDDLHHHHHPPDSTTSSFSPEDTPSLPGGSATEREQGGADSGSPSGGSAPHRIVCVRHFLASHGSDVKTHPGLVGICAVCKDRVAVSDRWNKAVKLLDISGRVMDVLAVQGGAEPWDLALRRPGVLAVTYPKEQKIRLLDVADGGSRLHYRSHFNTRDGYASLASRDPATLVASVCPPFGPPKLHVLDYMGVVLRALDCSQLAYPRCLDVCGGEEVLLGVCVSDWTHHNVKIFDPPDTTTTTSSSSTSSSPGPRHTYSGVLGSPDAQLKAPMGVAWNGREHVFIVDGKSSKLHAVCLQSGICSAIFSLPQGGGLGAAELKLVAFVDTSPELCRSERALVVTTTTGSVQVYDLCSTF